MADLDRRAMARRDIDRMISENRLPSPEDGRKRFSWSAIFAGALIAFMIQVTLNAIGLAIGAETIDPAAGQTPFAGVGIGLAIWMGVSAIVALFVGGWVAGRGVFRSSDGLWNGMATWAVSMVFTLYLVGTAVGNVVGGATNVVMAGFGAVGQAAGAAIPDEGVSLPGGGNIDLQSVKSEAVDLMQRAGLAAGSPEGETPGAQGQPALPQNSEQADAFLARLGKLVSGDFTSQDRQYVTNFLVTQTDLSQAEARQTVQRWESTAQKTQEKLGEAGEKVEEVTEKAAGTAAEGVSNVSWAGFAILLLTGGAASVGGFFGSKRARGGDRI